MENEVLYDVGNFLAYRSEPCDISQVAEIVDSLRPFYDGWRLDIETCEDKLLLYVRRDGSKGPAPSAHAWTQVSADISCIVIATEIQWVVLRLNDEGRIILQLHYGSWDEALSSHEGEIALGHRAALLPASMYRKIR